MKLVAEATQRLEPGSESLAFVVSVACEIHFTFIQSLSDFSNWYRGGVSTLVGLRLSLQLLKLTLQLCELRSRSLATVSGLVLVRHASGTNGTCVENGVHVRT
jgi:hypothetical protein